jgi:predicted PurR-regulated permease PerM
MILNRRRLLATLLVAVAALAAVVLAEVLRTVVFAVTVAYVLYPVSQWLVGRGLSRRIACVGTTVIAFVAAAILVVPLLYVLYRRRAELIEILEQIPDVVPISVGEFELVIEMVPYVAAAEVWVRQVAIAIAAAAPRLVLELVVFTFLVYGLLYRPGAVETAVFSVVPPEYHDIPTRLHERTRETLYSIYVLQAATAAGTSVLAFVVFGALGYGSPALLAVIAGVLQFIPIIGPSVLVVALAMGDLLVEETGRAIAVLVLGLVLVSFVPDAVIRTQLADWTGRISPGLYFVGFVGGILTLGAVGLIVGPLVVSLLLEVIDMLSERDAPPDRIGKEGRAESTD